ncbi:uncharacterized protein BJ212DRAFT_1481407 [Suillus subaureus]|uniref:Uncharacterized protein n=1 Tax=Suillus subaureus TaxID=48587 RepID=A0A9P7E9Y3_9AGAM|nr:uncharacterized protein BJ212DRAFT_1481407 [Suillus subaureus]KAG1815639.1 hypothetical protein BJ212DRAFT_1481407 [Suillus subaureus]
MFNASHPTIDIIADRTAHAIEEPPGAILVGVFIQFFFQGIIVIEAGQYYERECCARLVFNSLGSAQTAFEGYIAWKANVESRMLLMIPRAWFAIFLNGFISGINKLFLLRRCWRVTKGSWWIFVLFAFTITTYVANILIAVAFSRLGVVSPKPSDVVLSVISFSYWTTAVLVLDVILSSLFSYGKTKPAYTISTEHSCGFALSPQNLQSGHRYVLPVSAGLFFSHNANANRLVFVFLLQTGKLYTLSILRTLNAKVRLRERMKSDDFARGSLGNWSWRQADSGVDHEMSVSAVVTRAIVVPGGNEWTPVVDLDWAVGEKCCG